MKSIMTKVAIAMLMSMAIAPVFAQAEKHESAEQKTVIKITRNKQQVTMVTSDADGKQDTTVAVRTRVCEVSDSVKLARYEARLKGETAPGVYFDNKNKDITGRKLSRPFVELGGGGAWLFSSKEFRPVGRFTLGWESRYTLIFADFEFGTKGFSTSDDLSEHGVRKGAEAEGLYKTFSAVANGAVKLWNSDNFNSFIALYGGVGYTYAKTDGDSDDIRFGSAFYQFRWQAGLLAKYGFNSHWGLTGRLYIQNPSNNEHDSAQDAGKLAVGAQVGVNYSF
jgi:hypothetical protein